MLLKVGINRYNQNQMILNKKNQLNLLIATMLNIGLFTVLYFHLSQQFFIFDDTHFITNNSSVKDYNFSKFIEIFKNSLIPFSYNIWGTIGLIFGFESALPFKTLNLIIHLINANLTAYFCYLFLKLVEPELFLKSQNIWKACLAGALVYALHPTQAEAISWASCLKDVLSTFFSLIALTYYLRNRLVNKSVNILPVLLILALFTKPNTIVLIPVLCIIETFLFKRKLSKYLLGFIPVALGFIVLHLDRSFSKGTEIISTIGDIGVLEKLIVILSTTGLYLQKVLLPFPIYFFTYNKEVVLQSNYLFLSTFVFLLFVFLYHFKTKKINMVIYPLVFFLLFISPQIGLIENFFQKHFSIISSRYFNLPLISVALFISWVSLKTFGEYRRASFVSLSIIVSTLFYMMLFQLFLWRTSSTILEYSARFSPPHLQFYYAIATAYRKEGNLRTARYWELRANDLLKERSKLK